MTEIIAFGQLGLTHAAAAAKSLQLCLTLCNLMDCNPQTPLSMGFSREEYWSGLPFSPPEDLPDPGTGEPGGLPSMGSHRVGHD